MIKLFQSLAIAAFAFLFLTSCWQAPSPADGLCRHNSKTFRYRIDYPDNMCNVSLDNKTGQQVLQISDKNNNYKIHILALKTENDKRFKFDYYSTIDSLYYTDCGTFAYETKNFFNDKIMRTYSINKYITMESTSIYGGQCIYVIYSTFNEQGKNDAAKITNTFKSSSGIGPINFCKRKIYSIIGDNGFASFLCYLLFSLLFTFGFWGGIVYCCQPDNMWIGCFAIFVFIVLFGYIVLTDEFMGYIYGHNNLFHLIGAYILLFCDEG